MEDWLQDRGIRREATQKLMRIFDVWDIAGGEKLELLGACADDAEYLGRLREGVEILPHDEESCRRAMNILSIQRSLEEFAPDAPQWRDDWVHQPIKGLGYERPIDIMRHEGLPGIERVRRYTKTLGHL
ncbi:DUF2384 domain-containing protein [Aquisalimonas sp. 2447]|uniref:antitoxin Xre/MbcA/ParS toxin-binding domain-containing protein n=1 Tax=Aquisalimonas sp. 2447 TaxID=2740807 RepID=UPI0014324AEA|nr:antitoxin Xre/MbcA/ParS toxin-binding domain-containing protein [Aquisalimonas sp. 2447]QIT55009.1 DUF2384 domain-containing protein [Aquisalimonas sp. 2447]